MQTSTQQDDPIVNPAPAYQGWKVLYRTGGAAALISAVLIPIQVAVFLVWPPPIDGTVADWFTLLRDHRLAGLVDLDLLLVADNVLLIPILLAFYVALRRVYPSVVLIAVALGFVGVAMYLASNPAVQMAALSDQYAAATTDVERTATMAAGKAMLAMWQGTAFHTAYILGSVAGVLFGVVMLRSRAFSRPTGWLAIVANAVALGLYVPRVGVLIAVVSVLFLEVWYVLIARRLHQFGRGTTAGTRISMNRPVRGGAMEGRGSCAVR
jgi:hypothetical protein